ncbi:MAG: hypothetical protein ACREEM_08705 [Blastocatellia bacterium]
MTTPSDEFMERAIRAKDKLAEQFLNHPTVELIDIGYDLESPENSQQIVLRVHTKSSARAALKVPDEIDGIPVKLMTANYEEED